MMLPGCENSQKCIMISRLFSGKFALYIDEIHA
jgi:hypothetical protein